MITRVVKMTFRFGEVANFLPVFSRVKNDIRQFRGCRSLQLLGDKHHPEILFTVSDWDSEADLENYRNSELFLETWEQTKVLFAKRAEAWTLEVRDVPDANN